MFLRTRKNLFANPKEFFSQVEKFVFKIALPVYVFSEIAQADVHNVFNVKLVLYSVSSILVLCVLLLLITPVYVKNKKSRGAYINSICRPNFVLLGVPLVSQLTEGAGAAVAALILPFMVLLFNVLGVVLLAVHSDEAQRSNIKNVLLEIIKNPLIHAIVLSLPFMLFDIKPAEFLQRCVNYISATATPLALISLGAGIELNMIKSRIKLALTASLIKTALCPVLFVIPALLLGFNQTEMAVIFVLSAAPSAVVSYIMAKNMNSDADLAGQILALTTIICPVTIFIGSVLLKSNGAI
jgi:hypothetical protein